MHIDKFTGLARKVAVVVGIWLLLIPAVSGAVELPDLPACEAQAGNGSQALSLGVVQPYAAPEVVNYAVKLARQSEQIEVCSESWSGVVPRYTPWAGHLERGYGFVLFGLVLIGVVAVLTLMVPRQKWRRTTLVGVLAVGGLSWIGGVAALAAFHALGGQQLVYGTVVSLRSPQESVGEWLNVAGARELEAALNQRHMLDALPRETTSPTAAVPDATITASPNGQYRIFHRLNLREKPGVNSLRLAVLPTGDKVVFDGATEGDWWRVRTESGQTGWASSIWLRRLDEAVPSKP